MHAPIRYALHIGRYRSAQLSDLFGVLAIQCDASALRRSASACINAVRMWIEDTYHVMIAWFDGAEVSALGWGSGVPRFQSHPRLTFQSCSRYQLNQLGSKAASESTIKKSNTCGVSNRLLDFLYFRLCMQHCNTQTKCTILDTFTFKQIQQATIISESGVYTPKRQPVSRNKIMIINLNFAIRRNHFVETICKVILDCISFQHNDRYLLWLQWWQTISSRIPQTTVDIDIGTNRIC